MDLENVYKITANTKRKMIREIPEVIQNDNVVFEVSIIDDTTDFTLSADYSYKLVSLKHSGLSTIREGVLSGEVIRFNLGTSEMQEPGKVEATVQVYDSNMKRISTAKFDYVVKKDPSLQGSLPADNTSLVIANESLLTDAITKSNQASTDSSSALTKATTAETKATSAESKANTVQAQFDEVTKASTIDPQVSQALVGADGKTYTNLSKRFDSVDSSLAEKATKTKWKNKIGVALGDSITWQDGQPYTGNGLIAKGYQTLIKEEKGLAEYRNYGQSGKSMSGSTSGDTNVIGKTIDYTGVDFVTILAGTNDFKLNVNIGPLGKIGDTSFNTSYFIGAYRSLIEYILTQKPTIKIFLMTPLQRDQTGYDVNFVNLVNHKLIDYVNAVKRVGSLYSIPVLDLYSVSGITKLTLNTYTNDGLHPNDLGYARMTEFISPFLENDGVNVSVDLYPQKVYKGTVVYDSFNRADTVFMGTPDISPDKTPWESITGSGLSITNKTVVPTTTSLVIRAIDSGVSDNCEISVRFPTVSVDKRLYFRIVDSLNNFVIKITSGNVYQLSRVLNGTATTLGAGTTIANNGDVLKVNLKDTSIKVYINDTLEFSATDSNFLTATKHGIGSTANTSGSFDDFQVVAV